MVMNTQKQVHNARRMRKAGNKNGRYGLSSQGYTIANSTKWTYVDPHFYATLRYSLCQTDAAASGTAINQVMNLNSLFDPDRSGVGHQPYGFDQLAALYARYRVLKTKWEITFMSASSSNCAMFCCVVPTNGTVASVTTITTFQTLSELPLARHGMVSGSGPGKTIQGEIDLNQLVGTTKTEYLGDDRYEALVTASPAEVMVLNVAFFNYTAASQTMNYYVNLEFEVDFHDPILQSGSFTKVPPQDSDQVLVEKFANLLKRDNKPYPTGNGQNKL